MFKIRPDSFIIILFNFIPVIGVAYYNWAPFEMFWLFWMETLIIAFFNAIRVLYSQGIEPGTPIENSSIKLNFKLAVRYLIIRIFIFLFYSIFIIVFIGVMASSKKSVGSLGVIFFHNRLFNLALLLTAFTQFYYLLRFFFMNRAFYYSNTQRFPGIFDGRQIVIHIAVVLGAVGSSFLFKGESNAQWGAIWIIGVFCFVKCIFELYFANSEYKYVSTTT